MDQKINKIMKTQKTITLSPAEVKLLLATAIFASSVDISANWDEHMDKKFLVLAKKIAKQTGINDISKYISVYDGDDGIFDNPDAVADVKKSFVVGRES